MSPLSELAPPPQILHGHQDANPRIALSVPEHGSSDDFLRHKLPHSCHKSYLLWSKRMIQSDLDLLVKFIFEATRGRHWANGGFSWTMTVSNLYACSYQLIALRLHPYSYNPKILHPPSTSEFLKKKSLFHPQSEPWRRISPPKSSRIFSPFVVYAKTYPRAKASHSIHFVVPFSSSAVADESCYLCDGFAYLVGKLFLCAARASREKYNFLSR